ncbi:hypothetical protein E2C01_062756 [Portunus trituberculatus]|uniref:Uncharacterized protein n=1 Tax=Portunus trituberculatus TaxID=210409 RepID=A0A5B7HIY0_PORTR|nr:hypothetical protein [Portunus trituberculatus]
MRPKKLQHDRTHNRTGPVIRLTRLVRPAPFNCFISHQAIPGPSICLLKRQGGMVAARGMKQLKCTSQKRSSNRATSKVKA